MVSKELEQEFKQVITTITKEVTESVVQNSALLSVNKLNQSLQTLQEKSPALVNDIEKAGKLYTDIAQQSSQSLNNFNQHIDNWQKQQIKFLEEIKQKNSLINTALQKNAEQQSEAINHLQVLIRTNSNEQKNLISQAEYTLKSQDNDLKLSLVTVNKKVDTIASFLNIQNEAIEKKLKFLKILIFLNLFILIFLCAYIAYKVIYVGY